MNTLRTFCALMLLAVTGSSLAALDPQTYVVEGTYSQIGVPANEADRIEVQRCQGCQPEVVRFTKDTIYRVGGFSAPAMALNEFRQAVRRSTNKDELLFYVAYSANGNTVTELVVTGSE